MKRIIKVVLLVILLTPKLSWAGEGSASQSFPLAAEPRAVIDWVRNHYPAIKAASGQVILDSSGDTMRLQKQSRLGPMTWTARQAETEQGGTITYSSTLVQTHGGPISGQWGSISASPRIGGGSLVTVASRTVIDHRRATPGLISEELSGGVQAVRRLLEANVGAMAAVKRKQATPATVDVASAGETTIATSAGKSKSAGVEQRPVRLSHKQEVAGSIPAPGPLDDAEIKARAALALASAGQPRNPVSPSPEVGGRRPRTASTILTLTGIAGATVRYGPNADAMQPLDPSGTISAPAMATGDYEYAYLVQVIWPDSTEEWSRVRFQAGEDATIRIKRRASSSPVQQFFAAPQTFSGP